MDHDLARRLVAACPDVWAEGMPRVFALTAAEDPHIPTPPEEEWRSIRGWPDYEVSSHGRARTWRVRGARPPRRAASPTLLTGTRHHTGRVQLLLRDAHNRRAAIYLHVAVLEAFVGARPPQCEAAHLNGNPAANDVGNLRWVTTASNSAHRRIHGTMLSGEKSATAALGESDVVAIRVLTARGMNGATLAAAFGVDRSTINRAARGLSWGANEGLPDLDSDITAGILLARLKSMGAFVALTYGVNVDGEPVNHLRVWWPNMETGWRESSGPTLGRACASALVAIKEPR